MADTALTQLQTAIKRQWSRVPSQKAKPYQYLCHLSGVDSEVDPPKLSDLGHHLLNTNGIRHFRKQF